MSVKNTLLFTLEREARPCLVFSGPGIDNGVGGAQILGLLSLAVDAMAKVGGIVIACKVVASKFEALATDNSEVLCYATVPLNEGLHVMADLVVCKAPFRNWLQSVGYGPKDEDRIRLWLVDCLIEVIADNARVERPDVAAEAAPECDNCSKCDVLDICGGRPVN